MEIRNSTRRVVMVINPEEELQLEADQTAAVHRSLRSLAASGSTQPGAPALTLSLKPGEDLQLDGGTGQDDPPAILRPDGDGDHRRRAHASAIHLLNETDRPLRVFVERSLPPRAAFRLLGELGMVEVTEALSENGESALILRAP